MKSFIFCTILAVAAAICPVLGEESTMDAPDGVSITKDLSFLAPGREEKLDLYAPEGRAAEERSPAVVIIHGGGWRKGDKAREREFVTGTMLAQAGYVAVSINYELGAGKRWPTNLYDCKNAVRWLRVNAERLQIDPEKIGVIGGSAGGHLALMVAYTAGDPELSPKEPYPGVSDRVAACVDMYGITDLRTRKVTLPDGTPTEELKEKNGLFRGSREKVPETWALASPVTHVSKDSPPTFILHGTKDDVVDRGQSEELHRALEAAGVENTLRWVPGAGHAWPLKTKAFDLTGEVKAFFDRHLKEGVSQNTRSRRPNVVFISVDDLNDWEGALGGNIQVKTPNMDRLFSQGMLFTKAHCSQAVCTASRNSLLSGLHPSSSGWYSSTGAMQKSYNEVMGDHKMLPEHFRDGGYQTMAVGKVFHSGVSDYKDRTDKFWDETGPKYKIPKNLLERGDGYKGRHFYPFPKDGSQITNHYGITDGNALCAGALAEEDIPGGKMFDEIIAEWAVEKVEKDYEKPFFLAVGFVRPHVPFTAPKKYFDLYDINEISIPEVPGDEMADIPVMGKSIAHGRIKQGDHEAVVKLSDTYWKELVHGYLACVSFVDDQVGKVIDALEASEHAEDTIIVLWSDHGQHLGEKKHWRKQSLWEESTRVPLFFKVPGNAGSAGRCDRVVSLLDIYPTLVDLCGLADAPRLEGNSLAPLIADPTMVWEKPVLSTWYYKNHAIRSEDWRYIRYRDGTEELYNHADDPGEHTNLAGDPRHAEVIAAHKKWLPEKDALPAGKTRWAPDKLDKRIEDWEAAGSIPEWLR